MQHRQEAAESLPALKPWRHLSIRLSCYRCHSQQSKSCVPNFNQLCSAKDKIALVGSILPTRIFW